MRWSLILYIFLCFLFILEGHVTEVKLNVLGVSKLLKYLIDEPQSRRKLPILATWELKLLKLLPQDVCQPAVTVDLMQMWSIPILKIH